MDATIHEPNSRIIIDGSGVPTPMPVDNNYNRSTPSQGVPIITKTSVYTTYNSRICDTTMKRTKRNGDGILPLTCVHTYARVKDVPYEKKTLFAVDYVYPDSKKEKSSRFFRMDYIDFYQRLMVTPKGNRTYYECIEGDDRKPYADIEYEYKEENKAKAIEDFDLIIGYVLLGIRFEMYEKGVDYDEDRDCIKLSSHGPGKRSMHIIINGHYFDNCEKVNKSNVKSFWLAVRNRVPQHLWHFAKIQHGSTVDEYQMEVNPNKPLILDTIRTIKKKDKSETIDTCVYSSFRQFRLVWNTKLGKDRFLDIDPSTGIEARFPNLDDNLQRLRLFEGCLITMTSNCKKLPNWFVADPKKQTTYKNVVDIDDKQRNALVDAFNSSRHSNIYRINYHQSTSKNSIYLDPVTKPYDCLVCGGNHSGNNAKICYSASGSIYIKCFASNKIEFIGRDFGREDNDDEDDNASDFEGESLEFFGLDPNYLEFAKDNGISVPDNVVNAIEQRRVQVTPIINTNYQLLPTENNSIRASPTSWYTHDVYPAIINNKTTDVPTADSIGLYGQIIPPSALTTIATFSPPVNGNTISDNVAQRIQATPIINGTSQQLSVENNSIRASPTSWYTHDVYPAIINNKTTDVPTADSIGLYGQIIPPSETTTIASFLQGNTKFLPGIEYIIQEIFDAYERYRCGKGARYSINGGSDKTNFGRALTSLGHTIQRKGRSRTTYVTLKHQAPIVNTNPIEEINKITGKTVAPAMTVEDALNRLKQVPKEISTETTNPEPKEISTETTNPEPNKEPINRETRMMDPHDDIRAFWDIYMTEEPGAETDLDNLFLCFIDYCKSNNIITKGVGKTRLINFIKKWILNPINTNIDGLVLKGWKCKTNIEEINNARKEKQYRRIWKYNNVPYQIGWHNGRFVERYCKLTSKPWKKIDVHYRNDQYCRPIPGLIQLTNKFEKELPERVKEIQDRLLLLQYLTPKCEEAEALKMTLFSALDDGIVVKDSQDHILLRNRIEQLEEEAERNNLEEIDRLQESIKDDKERLMQEISWCITVRSTFGTGKTFQIKPFIEAFPQMRILIVLPRITLTAEYIEEYRAMGFIIYTEKPKGKINDPRVIVCYPSITRLDLTVNYDLLVLDEYKAIKDLQHTLVKKMMRKKDKITGQYKSRELKCYQVLCQLVANTKRVYVADALLTNAHVLEISRMRQQSDEFSKRVTVYQNLYQKHRGNLIYTVDNQELLTYQIIKFLREGKRVAVPTNIKGYGEFLHKMIMDLDINVTVSLSTGENKPTQPLARLWQNVQCMIYSPTILAGNSYEEPIDVVCGYFEKISCDQADGLQMFMRCRDVSTKSYYICFRDGPGKSPIPSNVYHSTNEIKKFFLKIKKEDLIKWSEEDLLSLEADGYEHIKYHTMYLDSYVYFMKQVLVSDREYLFRMLLYMRDAGFRYGGNIYTMTQDKEAVATIKIEKKEYQKERAENELEENYTCAELTTPEYLELIKKTNKPKDDLRRILKYRIKRIYNVNNVPKWLFKIHKKNYKQYIRINEYLEINGVNNQDAFARSLTTIRNKRLGKKETENQNDLTKELLTATTINTDPGEDIDKFWTERDIKLCEYACIILAFTTGALFIREHPRFETQYSNNGLNEYINHNEREIRDLVNDFDISIDNLASKVTNKAFGIKIKMTPTGYSIDNMWILKVGLHNMIWPYNWDFNDREDLRILVPEPTISDKSKSWINNKIVASVTLQVPKIPVSLAHTPPIGACVNNKIVQTQAVIPAKIVVPVQRRIPVVPIILNNFKMNQ